MLAPGERARWALAGSPRWRRRRPKERRKLDVAAYLILLGPNSNRQDARHTPLPADPRLGRDAELEGDLQPVIDFKQKPEVSEVVTCHGCRVDFDDVAEAGKALPHHPLHPPQYPLLTNATSSPTSAAPSRPAPLCHCPAMPCRSKMPSLLLLLRRGVRAPAWLLSVQMSSLT